MKIVKVFYDTETTGVNPKRHSIHQLAGDIEVNGEIVESFDIRTRPHPKALIEPEAMKICGVTEAEIKAYPTMLDAYGRFTSIIGKHVDKFNPKEKAFLIGFNNRFFDDVFLRSWFEQNGDSFIGSLFWNNSIDVLVLATEYLLERRVSMPSFKLKRVCIELGIDVDSSQLHGAAYDAYLTREAYRIVTGLEMEI